MLDLPKGVASVLFLPPNPGRNLWACSIVFYFSGERMIANARGEEIMTAYDLACREASRLMGVRMAEEERSPDHDIDRYRYDQEAAGDVDGGDLPSANGLSRPNQPDQEELDDNQLVGQETEEERIHRLLHPSWPLPNRDPGPPASLN